LKNSNKILRIDAFIYWLSREAAQFDKFVPSTFESALQNVSLSPTHFKPNFCLQHISNQTDLIVGESVGESGWDWGCRAGITAFIGWPCHFVLLWCRAL